MKYRAWIFSIIYVASIGLLLLHALSPAGFVTRHLPVSIELFAGLAVVLCGVVFRLVSSDKKHIALMRTYVTPISTLMCIAAVLVETLTYRNFVYSYMHLDPLALLVVSFFVLAVYFVTLTRADFKKSFSSSLMLLGLFTMHIVFLKWYNFGLYNVWSGEDNLFENITFFIYAIGAGIFGYTAYRLWQVKRKTVVVWLTIGFMLCCMVGYAGIAGEEISWGQRFFHFSTPQEYKENNSQGEFNLHNNEKIFNKIYYIYGSISLYVILSTLLYLVGQKRVPKPYDHWLRLMTFRWYHIAYFVPTLVYVSYRLYYQTSFYDVWEESTEVMFGLGMVLYAIHAMHVARKSFKNA